MKKKPFAINIIALAYLIGPWINAFQMAYLNHWPLSGPRGIFNHFSNYDWFIFALSPIVALGIYRVAKWGNLLFIGFSVILILHNSWSYVKNPVYSLYVVLLFDLGTLGLVGYFLQKHIFAVYFNPHLKWWEHPDRIPTSLEVAVKVRQVVLDGRILDISNQGCFIQTKSIFSEGEELEFSIVFREASLDICGKVVWVKDRKPLGYGVKFLKMGRLKQRRLARLVNDVKSAKLEFKASVAGKKKSA